MQFRRGKMRRRDLGTQQIAVAPKEIPAFFEPGFVSIADRDKAALAPEPVGQYLAERCEFFRRLALDRDQNEPGYDAVAQLIDQDLLRGRWRARQESREIGADLRAADDHD